MVARRQAARLHRARRASCDRSGHFVSPSPRPAASRRVTARTGARPSRPDGRRIAFVSTPARRACDLRRSRRRQRRRSRRTAAAGRGRAGTRGHPRPRLVPRRHVARLHRAGCGRRRSSIVERLGLDRDSALGEPGRRRAAGLVAGRIAHRLRDAAADGTRMLKIAAADGTGAESRGRGVPLDWRRVPLGEPLFPDLSQRPPSGLVVTGRTDTGCSASRRSSTIAAPASSGCTARGRPAQR